MSYYQRRDYKILPESVRIFIFIFMLRLTDIISIRFWMKTRPMTIGAKYLQLVNITSNRMSVTLQMVYMKPLLQTKRSKDMLYQVILIILSVDLY